ncbi:MAG TPA: tripartite tricarboxylate transporter substrate-binding protein [Alphaproteobacteria bacterium]|jgi:tripartite-type tricarboxylate transporter receptor subunit TctC|nr:tripartite tricarboxylate transporter substrate-binding protein [Alphaproteobacteria bacterium]
MQRVRLWFRVLVTCASALATFSAVARADAVADFYKGKTITLIVSSGSGGGYDTYSRALARHITRHIPGEPRIVVQNMPGAGSLTAVNYVYNVAAKDGAVIGDSDSTMPFYTLFEGQNTKFDPYKLNWIGSIANQISVCFAWHTSSFKTLDDAMSRPMRVSGTGAQSWRVTLPRLYNDVAGTKFEAIPGYSSSEVFLAVERGEVEGTCPTYDTLLATKFAWLQEKKIKILAQFGLTSAAGIEDVPLALKRVKDETDKAAMKLILSQQLTGRPYMAPPGVPDDRIAALRTAFEATMDDPQFRTDAEKIHLWISPLAWRDMHTLLDTAYGSPPEVIDRAKALMKRALGGN